MRTTRYVLRCSQCPASIELAINAVQFFGDETARYVSRIAEHQGWTLGDRPACPVHGGKS